MSDKIVKLHDRHKTLRSMAAELATQEDAERGFLIWFEKDGTMHFGDKNIQLKDVGMALMYMQMLAVQMMAQPDDK